MVGVGQLGWTGKNGNECIANVTGVEAELITNRGCIKSGDIHDMQRIPGGCFSSPLEIVRLRGGGMVSKQEMGSRHAAKEGRCNRRWELLKKAVTAIGRYLYL